MQPLKLGGWDYAYAVSFALLNQMLAQEGHAHLKSTESGVGIDGVLGPVQLVDIAAGGVRASAVFESGVFSVDGEAAATFQLDGVELIFTLPLSEVFPNGPGGDSHIALDFRHDGDGAGTLASNTTVVDQNQRLGPDRATIAAYVAELAVNALRDGPSGGWMPLATLLKATAGEWYKPLDYSYHLANNPAPYLCVMARASNAGPQPEPLPSSFLPHGAAAGFTVDRMLFFRSVVAPGLSARMPKAGVPAITYYPITDPNLLAAGFKMPWGVWPGELLRIPGPVADVVFKDLEMIWPDTFGVNFWVGNTLASVKFNTGFRLQLHADGRSIGTSLTHSSTIIGDDHFFGAILSTIISAQGVDGAVGQLLPIINAAEIVDLDSLGIHWPNLPPLRANDAAFEDGCDVQFAYVMAN